MKEFVLFVCNWKTDHTHSPINSFSCSIYSGKTLDFLFLLLFLPMKQYLVYMAMLVICYSSDLRMIHS